MTPMIQYLPMKNEFLKGKILRKAPVTDRTAKQDLDLIHEEAKAPSSGNFRA